AKPPPPRSWPRPSSPPVTTGSRSRIFHLVIAGPALAIQDHRRFGVLTGQIEFMDPRDKRGDEGRKKRMKFTKDHEWVRLEGDVVPMGISKHAAEALGDVVFVETPEAGKSVSKGDSFAVVESVKAASDVYAPVSGEVIE